MYKHEIFTTDTNTFKTLASHTELAGLKCWHLNDGSEYYRITLESHKDASQMVEWLVQECFSFDDVITEVLDVQ